MQYPIGKKALKFTEVDDNVGKWLASLGRTVSMLNDGYVCLQGYSNEHAQTRFHRLIFEKFVRPLADREVIDHINGDTLDNRLENLRAVSNRENLQNCRVHRNGKLVGTTYHKMTKKWRALIRCTDKDGKRIQVQLGSFPTEQDAHEAYMAALSELT